MSTSQVFTLFISIPRGHQYNFKSGGAWSLMSGISLGSNSETHYFMKKWGHCPQPPSFNGPVTVFARANTLSVALL